MKIGPLLAHLDELEASYAEALRQLRRRVTGRARRLPPVPHLRRSRPTVPRRSSSRSASATTARRLEQRSPRAGRGARGTSALYLLAHEVAVTWAMAPQAAKAARDQELKTLATECQTETETQAKWFPTRIKAGTPQALVSG